MADLKKLAVSQDQLRQYDVKIKDYIAQAIDKGVSEIQSATAIYCLEDYMTSGKSFTWSSDNAYVYKNHNTSRCLYTDSSTNYAVFKAADIDMYIVYTIGSDNTTYTYSTTYTAATLPSGMKALFEINNYAVVLALNGNGTDKWEAGRYSVFVDASDKQPMKYAYSGSLLLVRNAAGTFIYVYTLSGTNYSFTRRAASGTEDFTMYNAIIDNSEYQVKTVSSAAITIDNPTENTIVVCSNSAPTSINVASVSTTSNKEVVIFFTTGATAPSISASESQYVVGDIDISASTSYVMVVFRGAIVCQERTAYSAS